MTINFLPIIGLNNTKDKVKRKSKHKRKHMICSLSYFICAGFFKRRVVSGWDKNCSFRVQTLNSVDDNETIAR